MNTLNLDLSGWILVIICSVLIGFSKTGLSGAATLIIPVMASIFGGRASSGIVLPMLIIGDLIAVKKYNEHARWDYILKLLPWSLAGIISGLVIGNFINDTVFKIIISVIILAGLVVMIYLEKNKGRLEIPSFWMFAAFAGFLGGFTTMIGNAAGPVMTVYLLSMNLPKLNFIGTLSWFFMIINLIKVPLQIFFWKGITSDTLIFNALMIPAIFAGAFAGIILVKIIPEKAFRIIIMILTFIAAVKLIL